MQLKKQVRKFAHFLICFLKVFETRARNRV